MRICVASFHTSHNVGKARNIAAQIATSQPDKHETWFFFGNLGFKAALSSFIEPLSEEEKAIESITDKGTTIKGHHSPPFVWHEQGGVVDPETGAVTCKTLTAIGGCDKFRAWAQSESADNSAIQVIFS